MKKKEKKIEKKTGKGKKIAGFVLANAALYMAASIVVGGTMPYVSGAISKQAAKIRNRIDDDFGLIIEKKDGEVEYAD